MGRHGSEGFRVSHLSAEMALDAIPPSKGVGFRAYTAGPGLVNPSIFSRPLSSGTGFRVQLLLQKLYPESGSLERGRKNKPHEAPVSPRMSQKVLCDRFFATPLERN